MSDTIDRREVQFIERRRRQELSSSDRGCAMVSKDGHTLKNIIAMVERSRCKAVLEHIANSDAHKDDLPIRNHVTGKIVAYVPWSEARGCEPVAINGIVVGYYKETASGRKHPWFVGTTFSGWISSQSGEKWITVFGRDGTSSGCYRL